MAGIYIHIPFCKSRCIYCDFYSTSGLEHKQDDYVRAIIKEWQLRSNELHNCQIETIYVGGGTPSILSGKNITLLADALRKPHNIKEFTVECNPDDVSVELANTLHRNGVNRVSMGVQTFNDKRLSFLRRRHKAADITLAINNLREAGISNISIDLMFGFPGETLQDWEQDICEAIELNVEHLSAYSLMYEEGTPLYRMLFQEKKFSPIDEQLSHDMYEMLIDKLTAAGYEHYEISNFAKTGYRSLHNSNYWNGTPYVGLGAAAHSYHSHFRSWNVSDIDAYISSISKERLPSEKEYIDERTLYNDTITTALRTKDGIRLASLSHEEQEYLLKNAQKRLECEQMMIENGRIYITRKGLYVSDDIMSDLIWI